jgi:hypothetical protein
MLGVRNTLVDLSGFTLHLPLQQSLIHSSTVVNSRPEISKIVQKAIVQRLRGSGRFDVGRTRIKHLLNIGLIPVIGKYFTIL